ncbi:SigE family RNA polymerase sigma factor [Actinoplanes sp. NPDC023936]|uniref:SigE family RNA polymerase sigma factor n=1 Tax=Actinoplanes sp. NPDC023936 TaxID=3154910 RepID=UPI0033D195AD
MTDAGSPVRQQWQQRHDGRDAARRSDAAYREYVSARMDGWRRTAYLLCRDWHLADDLVATLLLKVFQHWATIAAVEKPDSYVRRILLRTALDERRRAWQRELPVGIVPERAAAVTGTDLVADRQTLVALVAALPPKRQRMIALRYLCDLSVEDTAAWLGCSVGNVKSQTSRALDTLRSGLREQAH